MSASVLIARYLVATGRREQAIAHLMTNPADDVIAELDRLDAVDALAQFPLGDSWGRATAMGRALGRRRRFDLLKPIAGQLSVIASALEGLWMAPAEPSDAVLIRDVLLPPSGPYERGECAHMLARLGDVAIARMIADELLTGTDRVDACVCAAPTFAALGEIDRAKALLDEASELVHGVHGDDDDGYGIPDRDAIDFARARIKYAPNPGTPWKPQRLVSNRFTDWHDLSRYGENRDQHERWRHALEYRFECRDVAGVMALVDEVRQRDPEHVRWLLVGIGNMPYAMLDDAVARRLVDACDHEDAVDAIAGLLAEAGFLTFALELVGKLEHRCASARVGAQLVPHDREAARKLVAKALRDGYGDAKTLAEFVAADLESAIRRA